MSKVQYEEAYKGFSDIIKQKLPIRIDIQCVAWVFKLIIAYEQEHENFVNLHRAAQRFFGYPRKVGQFDNQ